MGKYATPFVAANEVNFITNRAVITRLLRQTVAVNINLIPFCLLGVRLSIVASIVAAPTMLWAV